LNFSRIERDMAGMTITTFPLPELMEETIELVRARAEQRRIALTSRYLTDELSVKADRDKIAQVFINLLENAVKYNRDGGQVQVEVRKGKKGYLIVDVRDTGIGIPRDSLDRVFDRLYRVGGETPSGAPGSGIGLSIVRDILRMHGCIIKADSALGEGTVFTFTLPSANPSPAGEGDRPEGPRSEPAPRGTLPGTR
jgi:two-component system phosphate regulon sensor histidine kinase PhoR